MNTLMQYKEYWPAVMAVVVLGVGWVLYSLFSSSSTPTKPVTPIPLKPVVCVPKTPKEPVKEPEKDSGKAPEKVNNDGLILSEDKPKVNPVVEKPQEKVDNAQPVVAVKPTASEVADTLQHEADLHTQAAVIKTAEVANHQKVADHLTRAAAFTRNVADK